MSARPEGPLSERVEAAEGPSRELDCRIWSAVCPTDYAYGIDEWNKNEPRHPNSDTVGLTLNECLDRYPDDIDGIAHSYAVRRYTASLDAVMTLVPEGCHPSTILRYAINRCIGAVGDEAAEFVKHIPRFVAAAALRARKL